MKKLEYGKNVLLQLSKLKSKERKTDEELKEIKEECSHEIIVSKRIKTTTDKKVIKKTCCLICGVHLDPRKYLENKNDIKKINTAICIDLEDYPNALQGKDENPVYTLYELFRLKNPDASVGKIGKMIKEKLEETEETIK